MSSTSQDPLRRTIVNSTRLSATWGFFLLVATVVWSTNTSTRTRSVVARTTEEARTSEVTWALKVRAAGATALLKLSEYFFTNAGVMNRSAASWSASSVL